jgi:DNA-binding CsgD family transcriptional regulator
METRKVSEIVWREDLYPRINADPATIQKYAENLEVLPPIEINQHNELIDGYHRWTAHRKINAETIPVTVTQTISEAEFLKLAIMRNAAHGLQMSNEDKRSMARKLYTANGTNKDEIAKILSVTPRSVANWVQDIDKARKEERDRKIFEMWMTCYSLDEIAEAVNITKETVSAQIKDRQILESFPKSDKLAAQYNDADWQPQLYDIWTFSKNTNGTRHYGNTAVEIVDNLLYAFTDPFDVVVDPFGGGGSTIDICKKRLRRYWVSDRKPVVERPDIRQHDLTEGVSGPYHWGDVALVYLDPPYWKQAAGKYSDDPTDLANMPLDQFTNALVGIIEGYGEKLKPGAHVACIISPTQWPNEDKHVDYHDIDLACRVRKNLKLSRRVICPYSTEQYNGTQVNIAKERKLWMVLSRTMLIWERV